MAHYAEVTDGTVVNVVLCDDPDFARAQRWVSIEDMDPQPWIGWTFSAGEWSPPAEVESV